MMHWFVQCQPSAPLLIVNSKLPELGSGASFVPQTNGVEREQGNRIPSVSHALHRAPVTRTPPTNNNTHRHRHLLRHHDDGQQRPVERRAAASLGPNYGRLFPLGSDLGRVLPPRCRRLSESADQAHRVAKSRSGRRLRADPTGTTRRCVNTAASKEPPLGLGSLGFLVVVVVVVVNVL
jgi:hypothetical protein